MPNQGELNEILALNNFKKLRPMEKRKLVVYYSQDIGIYIFRYADGEWSIGASLDNKEALSFWLQKLRSFLMEKRFDIGRSLESLEKQA